MSLMALMFGRHPHGPGAIDPRRVASALMVLLGAIQGLAVGWQTKKAP
jgi:hypothetical protein